MSGGQTHTTQSSNPNVYFAPTSSGGGSISIGGNVGTGNVDFSDSSSATGPTTGLNFGFGGASAPASAPVDAPTDAPVLMLMNLASYDQFSQKLAERQA
jgi:hypothetical protein